VIAVVLPGCFVNVQSTEALAALLDAVPELAPPPYILVGHSAGGQLAMHFAQTYGPNKVAGLTLLDRWVCRCTMTA
jgi:pimeloyl-ACP methyl ester carboxylesterase